MSLIESFTRGHRSAEFWHALASKGSVTGRGLVNISVDVKEASIDDLRIEGATDWGYVIPHTASPADAKTALLRMIATDEKTDEYLVNEVIISSCRMMHAPVLLFGCRYDTEWTAAIGFDRNEYYTDTQRNYDSKSEEWREKHVTKTNIVTDWQLSDGTDSDHYTEIGYAGGHLPPDVVKWIETAEFSSMEPLNARQLANFDRAPQTQNAQAVFERGIQARAEQAIEMGVRACLQGDRVRDCQWSTRLDAISVNALIPLCHITFVIRGETLNFWAYGLDLSKSLSDPLPFAREKGKEGAKMAPVAYAFVAAMLATFAVAERTKEGVLAWIVLFFAICIYSSGKQTAYVSKLKQRRESALQARLLELENSVMNHNAADVQAARVVEYTPEAVDKVASTYIPLLLIFALVISIYRSYAGHSAVNVSDGNRAAATASKSPSAPARLSVPIIKAHEPEGPANSEYPPQPKTLNEIAEQVGDTKKNFEQDFSGPSSLLDNMNALRPDEARRIRTDLTKFQAKTGFAFGIIITDKVVDGDFADLGVQLCNEWAAHNKQIKLAGCVVLSKTKIGNSNFYFNVAKGHGIKITEAETLEIIQKKLEPALKNGDIYSALHETVEAVQTKIADEATKVDVPSIPEI